MGDNGQISDIVSSLGMQKIHSILKWRNYEKIICTYFGARNVP